MADAIMRAVSRRGLLTGAAVLCVLALLVLWPWVGRTAGPLPEPNIVLIVIDTLRADHLPFLGYSRNTAPFLSTLATRGIVFTRAYSTSSWTAPATASILTSAYPIQHNVLAARRAGTKPALQDGRVIYNRIPSRLKTLPEILARAGYRTYAVSDNPMIGEQGFGWGFEEFAHFIDQGATRVNEQVESWRPRILSGGKYFLYIHYMDPHEAYQKRAPWYARSDDPALDRIAAYDSEISYVDAHIADLYRSFTWDANTVVIVTADHGEEFLDHGALGHAKTLFNEVLHVPLIVVAPGNARGSGSVDSPVSQVDIAPTITAFVGLPLDSPAHGIDLTTLVNVATPRDERSLYAHLSQDPSADTEASTSRALVRGSWKYIATQPGTDALYDLARDPAERTDVIAQHPEIGAAAKAELSALESSLVRYEAEYYDAYPSVADQERMRALGYGR